MLNQLLLPKGSGNKHLPFTQPRNLVRPFPQHHDKVAMLTFPAMLLDRCPLPLATPFPATSHSPQLHFGTLAKIPPCGYLLWALSHPSLANSSHLDLLTLGFQDLLLSSPVPTGGSFNPCRMEFSELSLGLLLTQHILPGWPHPGLPASEPRP